MLVQLGSAIKRARLSKGVKRQALARSTGLTAGFLRDIEAGQARPSLEDLLTIALKLEIPPKEIYGGIGQDPKAAKLTEHSEMLMDLYEAAKEIRK